LASFIWEEVNAGALPPELLPPDFVRAGLGGGLLVADGDDLAAGDLNFGGPSLDLGGMASYSDELPALIIGGFGDDVGLEGFGVEEGGVDVFFEMGDTGEDE
jgi:hypothetical protein